MTTQSHEVGRMLGLRPRARWVSVTLLISSLHLCLADSFPSGAPLWWCTGRLAPYPCSSVTREQRVFPNFFLKFKRFSGQDSYWVWLQPHTALQTSHCGQSLGYMTSPVWLTCPPSLTGRKGDDPRSIKTRVNMPQAKWSSDYEAGQRSQLPLCPEHKTKPTVMPSIPCNFISRVLPKIEKIQLSINCTNSWDRCFVCLPHQTMSYFEWGIILLFFNSRLLVQG